MNLISQVVFRYNISAKTLNVFGKINSVKELKKIVKKANYERPYNIEINRTIQIIDTDIKPKKSAHFRSFFSGDKEPTVCGEIPCESYVLTVMDKLIYPNDVHILLLWKYGNVFDFDKSKLSENTPIKDFCVLEKTAIGLRKKPGLPPKNILRHVEYQTLDTKTVVVDTDLNQIWPQKTNTVPSGLVQLLAKTTEQIRQG